MSTLTTSDPLAGTPGAGHARAHLQVRGAEVALGGAPVLRGADITVEAGRTLALLGPSGCGKTTLLRAISGLQRLDAGTIELDGRQVTGVPAEKRNIGMVFQDGALFPHLDVSSNVSFGLPRRERRGGAVQEALEMVGLAGMGDRMPATLSGGQQQRVALARALVTEPAVLLLDEPFSALDAGLRTQVRADVARLLRSLGITAVVVTHDQEEAFLLGDEVAVMIAGLIHQQAAPAELYAAPASRDVAVFLGEANLVAGTASGPTAETWLGAVPLRAPSTGPIEVLVRPEHLEMSAEGPLRVEAVEYYGHDAITRLHGPRGALHVRTMAMPTFGVGDAVSVAYQGPPAVAYEAAPPAADLLLR